MTQDGPIADEARVTGAEAPQPAPPRLPQFVGAWKTETDVRDSKWGKQPIHLEGESRYDLVAGGKFLRGRHTQRGIAYEGMSIDPVNALDEVPRAPDEVPRSFYFDSRTPPGRDVWDPARHVFGWSEMMLLIHGTRGRFVTPDRVEDEDSTRHPDGGLVEYKHTLTRLDVGPEGPAIEPKCPEDMKILERLVGTWDTKIGVDENADPRKDRVTGTATCQLVLGGRFIQIEWSDTAPSQGFALWTYDTEKKAYLTWMFSSDATTQRWTGKWAEDIQSLIMGSEPVDERDRLAVHFVDKGTIEWSNNKDNQHKAFNGGVVKWTRRK
jgi:hypothetical protein